MVARLVDKLVPGSDKERRALRLHLITTSEYFKAHGLYVFEQENKTSRKDSEDIIKKKIQKLIVKLPKR